MDFGTLLNVAQKNSLGGKKGETSKYYSTKFEAPKKETKDRKLSANIQKFLQTQKADELRKQREDKQKLDELMAMRDTKSKNKIRKMLKVTKSANKSVLEDAVDEDNTAYTLQGPEQPDEDDYGYVSTEAGALYKKLMDKYKSCPEDEKKFSASRPQSKYDLDGTKDRVRQAINREREEEHGPHRRKRSSHAPPATQIPTANAVHVRKRHNLYDPEAEKREEEQRKRDEQRAKTKNRQPPPPIMDFATILKLAEKKQFEPVAIEVEVKKKEPERLLTTKEKREHEERQAFLAEREKRKQERDRPSSKESSLGRIPKLVPDETRKVMEPNGRIPKLNSSKPPATPPSHSSAKSKQPEPKKSSSSTPRPSGSSSIPPKSSTPSSSNSNSNPKPTTTSSSSSKLPTALTSRPSQDKPREYPPKDVVRKGAPLDAKQRPALPNARPIPTKSTISPSSSSSATNGKTRPLPNGKPSASAPSSASSSSSSKLQQPPKSRPFPPADVKTRQFPPADVKTRQFPPADIKNRQFPPADVKTRQFPPGDATRRPTAPAGSGGTRAFPPRPNGGPLSAGKRPLAKRHVIEDDDSEYDSEMDDFIDDGPDEENYSKYIKEIFGYDKSRYKNMDEDVDNMESNFAQQMKEEFISKKLGLMEDLEDMRMEAEEKKRAKNKRRKLDSDDDDD